MHTVFNRQVAVETSKRDRYGRLVGKVLVDGADACLTQIEAGMAWHFKKYEEEQTPRDRAIYIDILPGLKAGESYGAQARH